MAGDPVTAGDSGADARSWLEARLGGVPGELAGAMRTALDSATPGSAGTPAEALADAALAELDSVLGAAERDRRSALRLLSADALLTYAFEAAADPAAGGSAALAESLAERIGPSGALGSRIAAIGAAGQDRMPDRNRTPDGDRSPDGGCTPDGERTPDGDRTPDGARCRNR